MGGFSIPASVTTFTKGGFGVNATSSPNVDTSGYDMLGFVAVSYFGPVGSVQDSKSIAWQGGTMYQASGAGNGASVQMWYGYNLVALGKVGGGHNFTINNGSYFTGHVFGIQGGLLTSDPHDQESGGSVTGTNTPVQPGPITPTTPFQIIITALAACTGTYADMTVDAPFTKFMGNSYDGVNGFVGSVGYEIQGSTPTTRNPHWGATSTIGLAAVQMSFKPQDLGLSSFRQFRDSGERAKLRRRQFHRDNDRGLWLPGRERMAA